MDLPRNEKPRAILAKSGLPELDLAIGKSVHPHLVNFRAVGAVVQDDNQHLQAVTRDRLQFLNVHDQAAVAVDQQQLAVFARRRDADRV